LYGLVGHGSHSVTHCLLWYTKEQNTVDYCCYAMQVIRLVYGPARLIVQNPLHPFPRNFPVDMEVANLLPTCWQVVVMESGKRHDTTDTTATCCGETGVMDFGLRSAYRMVEDASVSIKCASMYHCQ